MAAFSYTHSSLLLDSSPVLFQVPEFSQQPTSISSSTTTCTAQFHHDIDHQSLTKKKHSPGSSTSSVVVDQNHSNIGKQFNRKMSSVDKKRKDRDGSPSTTTAQSMRITKKKSPKGDNLKEKKPKADKKKVQKKKVPEEVEITGYVHVRARRGEATDSHSLAERARREKISERMKLLQSLVPGCDKISGKAFVLDEIISYVQTLQTQVEFLSMKLASVDPSCNDFGTDLYALVPKPEVLDTHLLSQPTFQECNTFEAMSSYGDEQTKTSFNMPSSCYPLLDSPHTLQFDNNLLMEMPNILHQDDTEQFWWDMDTQRQKQPNHVHYGFTTNLEQC